MAQIDSQLFDIGYMDTLSRQDTSVHRLDPRAKLLTTLVFVVTVVSFQRYEVSALLPFLLYPIYLLTAGNVPLPYLLRKMLLVAPFAIMLGMFNPILDRATLMQVGSLEISGGWVSFASILLRFILTVGAALTLIAVTGFNNICAGMDKLGAPRIFVVQLMFLYRYLFVLADETVRMVRARSLRSFGTHGKGLRVYGSMVGHLLLRTLDRAQRIHLAMTCRGFTGEIPILHPLSFNGKDGLFVLAWSTFFIILRTWNLPQFLGDLLTGVLL